MSGERWPRAGLALIAVTAALALALVGVAGVLDAPTVEPLAALGVAGGMVLGELLRIELPYRHSSSVRFTLSDTAFMVGLLVLDAGTVLLGVALAQLVWQVVDRAEGVKFLFNLSQYVAGAAAAVATHAALLGTAGTGPLLEGLAFASAIGAFLTVNTLAVSGIVAITAEAAFRRTLRRMGATNALVIACNGALALLAVTAWDQNPYALPALAAPLALVFVTSRQRVAAQLDRERSAAFVRTEHRLGEATTVTDVAAILVAGVEQTLALRSAVWRHGRWATRVPPGSAPCPLDPAHEGLRHAPAEALGPRAGTTPAIGVGFGSGVLVAWQGVLAPSRDVEPWLQRLATSASVHFERVEALTALERERATLRAVVDHTADGIFVLDADGDLALWNPAMRGLTGVEDALGRAVTEVLGPGPWNTEGVHDVSPDEGSADDRRVWRVAVSGLAEGHDADRLRVVVVHDVSEERRVARMKDDLLSVVGHELRTPLTPIKASSQLLSRRADQLDEAQRAKLLAQIEQSADHLGRRIEDLILVAQLSSRAATRPRVNPATADLVAVVAEEVERARAASERHTLVLEAPSQMLGATDALRLRQVLANLLDNSCKFSPAGSTVTVRLAEEGDDAVLDIIDEGRGIPPRDRERVFERFERLEDPVRMTTSGAGLGLAIVRALVAALGGRVGIVDAPRRGTTVRVRLPLLGAVDPLGDRPDPAPRSSAVRG